MKNDEEFIVRWAEFLRFSGMSAKELADFLNVSHNYIYDLRKGKANPSSKVLQKLGEIETVDGRLNLHWLLLGEGEMFVPLAPKPEFDADLAFGMLAREFENLMKIVPRIDKLEAENAQLREEIKTAGNPAEEGKRWQEGFTLLADCYTTLKDDFSELRSRFEAIHGQTMRPPMYEAIEGSKRAKLQELMEAIEKKD